MQVELSFPTVSFGNREIPWSLESLLYLGGASLKTREAQKIIKTGDLGKRRTARASLLQAIRDTIMGRLAGGSSRYTVREWIKAIRSFYSWCDHVSNDPTFKNVESLFLAWTAHIDGSRRDRRVANASNYRKAYQVGMVLDQTLELSTPLIRQSRLRKPRPGISAAPDKQNLEDIFNFGIALTDICSELTADSIRGKLPIEIKFRTGQVVEEWARLIPSSHLKAFDPNTIPSKLAKVKMARDSWESDTSARTRKSIINIRIEAELLIFVSQTGMNLSQVQNIRLGQFSYISHINGYLVSRVYKNRKGGEVRFPIYSEYRVFFEKYLSWLKEMSLYEDEGRLFPLISTSLPHNMPAFRSTKRICAKLDIRFIGPAALRKSRINWLARKTGSAEITAEMAQHSRQTLFRNYLQPNHQIALAEISRFHMHTDPTYAAPAPGVCVKPLPSPEPEINENAPAPDCISPAGCMFCAHHRDIASSDHVWSLMSYRRLKFMELSTFRPSNNLRTVPPAKLVIERINEKLAYFDSCDEQHIAWSKEASARIDEGDFHPMWDGFLRLAGA